MNQAQLHLFNRMCNDIFKPPVENGEQWLPLIEYLLWHQVNVLKQYHLFSDFEYYITLEDAIHKGKLLLLPSVTNVPIETLELEAWVREFFFRMFDYENIQAEVVKPFRVNWRNDAIFHYSIVELIWQRRIATRDFNEYNRQLFKDPMKREMYGFAILERADALGKLGNYFLNQRTQQELTDHEREEATFDALYKKRENLLQDIPPLYELRSALDFTPTVVESKQIDAWRNKHRQKRYPEGGFVSLDAEVETTDGSRTSMLEILEAESESLRTQPQEIEEDFTPEQRRQLEKLLGKTGWDIFEYRYRHPDIIGHGEKKIIAQALGIAESTVGRYIGTQKRIGIIEANAEKIQKIL